MKYSLLLSTLLLTSSLVAEEITLPPLPADNHAPANVQDNSTLTKGYPSKNIDEDTQKSCDNQDMKLTVQQPLRIYVTGQGVAPCDDVCSPAQAYALAKRAAITDAYRLIAEKVKGVYVDGQDYIRNMMVKRSVVRTNVNATVRNANVVETTFKDGLCEVEMEIVLYHSQFAR